MLWLPEPPPGTQVCLGFDGADVSDWSGFGAETRDGYSFTPRRALHDDRPAIWKPEEALDGRIPRDQQRHALDGFMKRFRVMRLYADPWRYETDLEDWALAHGVEVVISWPTNRPKPMHEALERFHTDLTEGRIKQDGCPLTALAMDHARKVATKGAAERYGLAKPSDHQKIDPTLMRVLAHEAAADSRAEGWPDEVESKVVIFR
ncbi:MAG: terminase [Aeromicrobium sp.]|uniref:terminase n=1 Tax=Aeromicrobium sp. TaxID=1871063 RepID=UPI0026375901|nr:terminase [Aeromicrobium sp.]MDF1705025.1 terminase [Aeromicrobium sp.]